MLGNGKKEKPNAWHQEKGTDAGGEWEHRGLQNAEASLGKEK